MSAPPNRLLWLDFSRVVAAIAIVWLHTPQSEALLPTTILGRFAVPFFTATAVFMAFYSSNRASKKSFLHFTTNRLRRIYLPFVAWSMIYYLIRLLASLVVSTSSVPSINLKLLWHGTSNHLWFLPFIVIATLFSNLVGRILATRARLRWPATIALLSVALASATDIFQLEPRLTGLFWLSYLALPSLCLGLSLAIFCDTYGTRWLSQTKTILPAVCGFVAFQLVLLQTGRNIALENLSGFCLLLSGFASTAPWQVGKLARLGPLAFGIFLSHVIFIEGLQDLYALASLPSMAIVDVLIFVISTFCAWLTTWLLKRYPATQWLAP